jgi:hypothetical protein
MSRMLKRSWNGRALRAPRSYDRWRKQFHGDVMATLEDPFGYLWFFATHVEDVEVDDRAQRSAAYEPTHSSASFDNASVGT